MPDLLVKLYDLPDLHAQLKEIENQGILVRRPNPWEKVILIEGLFPGDLRLRPVKKVNRTYLKVSTFWPQGKKVSLHHQPSHSGVINPWN
jgi:hypothetical protein